MWERDWQCDKYGRAAGWIQPKINWIHEDEGRLETELDKKEFGGDCNFWKWAKVKAF